MLATYHASQRRDDRSTSGQQHSCYEDVGHDAKDGENPEMGQFLFQFVGVRNYGTLQMGGSPKSRLDDLEESVSIRSTSLELNCNTGKQQNLDRSSRSIPERPRYTVFVGNGGALQKSCSPCPG